MDKDCKGAIIRVTGKLKMLITELQCLNCPEGDCVGKKAMNGLELSYIDPPKPRKG